MTADQLTVLATSPDPAAVAAVLSTIGPVDTVVNVTDPPTPALARMGRLVGEGTTADDAIVALGRAFAAGTAL